MSSILLSALAIMFFINTTNGLDCSYCKGKECGWGLAFFNSKECPEYYRNASCYTINGERAGVNVLAKGCLDLPLGEPNYCNKVFKHIDNYWNDGRNLVCQTCRSDECNSLGPVFTSIFIVVTIVVIIVIVIGVSCFLCLLSKYDFSTRPTSTRNQSGNIGSSWSLEIWD